MMVKGDQDGLRNSDLYMEQQDIFNYYLQCIIEFSQQFDPTETLMIIANDQERSEIIHNAPDHLVPLKYITTDLWPKLGFLPIDPENPGVALIAEFMLNELILKNSESLEQLNLQHLKELFSGEGDDEGDEEVQEDDEEGEDIDSQKHNNRLKHDKRQAQKYSDSEDEEDHRAMDIGALKRQQQQMEKGGDSDNDGYEDDFN